MQMRSALHPVTIASYWFEHDAELTVAALALSRCRVLVVNASVPPKAWNQRLMPVPTEPQRLRNRLDSTNVEKAFASDCRSGPDVENLP